MNISKQYDWQPTGNCRENNLLLPQSLRGLVCGKTTVIFNLLLQPGWLDYNHLFLFGKSLHQQEYKVPRKVFEGCLSKQQISNVFNSQQLVMERYELIFTTIARIFQIHQHWTIHKRSCCCWKIVS